MANEENKKLQSLSNFAKKMSVTLRETSKEQSILSADEFYLRKYRHVIEYTPEQVDDIIATGSLNEKHTLSRKFFEKSGLYKRIILYYATLLTYQGILVPQPKGKNKLSNDSLVKRYNDSLEFLSRIPWEEWFTKIAIDCLVDGTYYGILLGLSKDGAGLLDLPWGYCRSLLRDTNGHNILEFNVQYFDTIENEKLRRQVLESYPSDVRKKYKQYKSAKGGDPWVVLDSAISVCFSFLDSGVPPFLSVIPATIQYDDAVDTERERELEEVRKIVVQKIPHLQDGQLLFEPIEAEELHQAAVNALQGNKNISVLTTYADVEAIISKTSADNVNNSLEKMLQNVYSEAGASAQIFSATGTQAIMTSIKNDMSLMMVLGRQFGRFTGDVVNYLFANNTINFKYVIIPISIYTQDEFIDNTLKMAQSGYSFLIPALASGLQQRDFLNIKDLENDVLKLHEKLIPLSISSTQSAKGEPGRPEKKLEDKTDKTIQNENAIDRQGGSD